MDRRRNQVDHDSTNRFSDRVDDYVKYRPGYPEGLFDFMNSELGLTPDWTVADIGSGTGISTRPFLDNGNHVFGIEPNTAMREASESILNKYKAFEAIDGNAESTKLTENCVDLVFCAQSFHWFCNDIAAAEFRRILRPGGFVGLVWNERETEKDRCHAEYEEFIKQFSHDYEVVRHDSVNINEIERIFGNEFTLMTYTNSQVFDLTGLTGRVISSSYMPGKDSDTYPEMVENLKALFAVHEEFGKISVSYQTKFYYCEF